MAAASLRFQVSVKRIEIIFKQIADLYENNRIIRSKFLCVIVDSIAGPS